jgi:hypothetical protein
MSEESEHQRQQGPEAVRRKYARLVARAWMEPEFAVRLKSNPAEVLREAGIEVPAEVEMKVVTDPTQGGQPAYFFTLPPKPESLVEELSDEQLLNSPVGLPPLFTTCPQSSTEMGCDCKG